MNSIDYEDIVDYIYNALHCMLYSPRLSRTLGYHSLILKDYIALKIYLSENSSALVKSNNHTLLHEAAATGDTKAIEILLAHGFDPNASFIKRVKDMNHVYKLEVTVTPLFLAVLFDNEDAIMMLREAGACMEDLKSKNHWALFLMFKICMGRIELFEELLNYADSLDERDPNGISYLEMSIVSGNNKILQVLLDRGVDINDQNNTDENTPLHVAVIIKNLNAVRILCDANCRLDLKNKEGLTALCLAVLNREFDIIKELILYDSNPDVHRSCIDNKYIDFSITNEEEDPLHWLIIFFGANLPIQPFFSFVRLEITEVIMKFHVKTQIAGINFQLNFKIPEGISSPTEDFRNRCLDEIKMMKKRRLLGDISMYSFLRASRRSLVVLSSKEQVKDVFSLNTYNEEYPLYKPFLEYNFRIGQIYQPVYDRAYDSLNAATEFILPDLVIHQILEYIDRQSMKCLIEAAEPISKINIANLHL